MTVSNLQQHITQPVTILDEQKCRQNIRRMKSRADENQAILRPHFKTHQSAEVGKWLREAGIHQGTVSSVSMAKYFVECGWEDLTIAFPINPREWPEVQDLASKASICITISSPHVLDFLVQNPPSHPLGVFIKIDVGTRRTGLRATAEKEIKEIITSLQNIEGYTFRGFLCHAGHAYQCRSQAEIQKVHDDVRAMMLGLRERFAQFEPFVISSGDTPTCSNALNWDGIDEMRAGNFVFYDLMQWQIGACSPSDIAVCLACPVVALHPERNSVIVYGGGIHLSKDRIVWDNKTIYGMPVHFEQGSLQWTMPDGESFVSRISQEHGELQVSDEFLKQTKVGDLIGILPVHSCMTADVMKSYLLSSGDTIEMMQRV